MRVFPADIVGGSFLFGRKLGGTIPPLLIDLVRPNRASLDLITHNLVALGNMAGA